MQVHCQSFFDPDRSTSAHALAPGAWVSRWRGLSAVVMRPRLARYQAFASRVASLIELHPTDAAEVGSFAIGRAPVGSTYQVDDGCEVDEALSRAFAHVCAVLYSTLSLRAYPTQIMAARVMLDGRVAEMATGEGKTVAIAIAAAVAALENPAVHVITANDYLAERDARELAPFYAALGLSVGAVTQPMDKQSRAKAWAHRITYCSAKELVFDYLRDGLIRRAGEADLERRARRLVGGSYSESLLVPALCVAIVDEIDTVLIDEASVPLVLSQQGASEPEIAFLNEALTQASQMQVGADFVLRRSSNDVVLTDSGRQRLSSWPKSQDSLHNQIRHREASVTLALVALHALHRDMDYVLLKGEVLIIDPSTGRAAIGRAWSRGLHQLVELKEGCRISRRADTVSRMTYQRFFPRYRLLCGMSGTLAGSEYELGAVYNLRIVAVPPRLPSLCRHFPLALYANTESLWDAVVQHAAAMHATGRPVLIGTASVLDSDRLAALFAKAGLATAVLNARQDHAESNIISAAGQPGRITVSTSMAGRGTDIKLDVDALRTGGLHVILCQHNISPRIDRQFLGRTARQGQPGSRQVMLALDFPLLCRVFPERFRPQLLLLPTLVLRATVRCCQGFAAYTACLQRQSLSRADDDSERELLFNREKFS